MAAGPTRRRACALTSRREAARARAGLRRVRAEAQPAPIHHHFELQAWSETKIILRFWIVAAVCSAIGFTLYQQSVT